MKISNSQPKIGCRLKMWQA